MTTQDTGQPISTPPPATQPPTSTPPPVKHTWMPTTAGILSIIGGAIGIIGGLFSVLGAGMMGGMMGPWGGYGGFGGFGGMMSGIFTGMGIFGIVLGVVAVIGGIYAVQRRVWGMALAGAICAVFSWFGILGILAIIFVSIGKKEFA